MQTVISDYINSQWDFITNLMNSNPELKSNDLGVVGIKKDIEKANEIKKLFNIDDTEPKRDDLHLWKVLMYSLPFSEFSSINNMVKVDVSTDLVQQHLTDETPIAINESNKLELLKNEWIKYSQNDSNIKEIDFLQITIKRLNTFNIEATKSKYQNKVYLPYINSINLWLSALYLRLNELEPQNNIKHEHIFSNNGYQLFEHIIKKYIKPKGVRGHNSDLFYFYWRLFNDKHIHQRPTPFFEWYNEKYSEDIDQFKTLNQVKNPNRDNHYSNSLDWFKQQL
jgi:hypothetical protein